MLYFTIKYLNENDKKINLSLETYSLWINVIYIIQGVGCSLHISLREKHIKIV